MKSRYIVLCLKIAVLSKALVKSCNFAVHGKNKVRNPRFSLSAIIGGCVG